MHGCKSGVMRSLMCPQPRGSSGAATVQWALGGFLLFHQQRSSARADFWLCRKLLSAHCIQFRLLSLSRRDREYNLVVCILRIAVTRRCFHGKHNKSIHNWIAVGGKDWISVCLYFSHSLSLSWELTYEMRACCAAHAPQPISISLSCRANKEASHLLARTRSALLRCNWSCKGHIFGIEITVLSLTCVAWTRDASHSPRVLHKPLLFITLALWAMTSTNA